MRAGFLVGNLALKPTPISGVMFASSKLTVGTISCSTGLTL
ncbi:MAG: hypothetical protein QNJ32_03480 [Xenococcaceae cyanobacterium MO_167.B27]|nr:hypothetical protein [Xenococcaceae cyanobacterium MO_167.B27]